MLDTNSASAVVQNLPQIVSLIRTLIISVRTANPDATPSAQKTLVMNGISSIISNQDAAIKMQGFFSQTVDLMTSLTSVQPVTSATTMAIHSDIPASNLTQHGAITGTVHPNVAHVVTRADNVIASPSD